MSSECCSQKGRFELGKTNSNEVKEVMMKVHIKKVCLAVFCICGLVICAEAAECTTVVCYPIDEDTTWDTNGSPYCLRCKISIRNGATLTIEPGVKVGTGTYGWTIEVLDGSLIANGVEHFPYSYNYYVGIEVPNSEGFVHLSDCNAFGRIEFDEGSSGIVEDCNIVEHIEFLGPGTWSISGNNFSNSEPLWIADPDVDPNGISGNTYTGSDPHIRICGRLDNDRTLECIDNGRLCKYRFRCGDLTIMPEATLDIIAGLEIETVNQLYRLVVCGLLRADEVTFSSTDHFRINNDGNINLSDCNIEGHINWQGTGSVTDCNITEYIDFQNDSNGIIEDSNIGCVKIRGAGTRKMFGNAIGHIELHDEARAGCIAYNTITESKPFRIYDPDIDANGICLNDYTGSDPNIVIRGELNRDYTLGFIDGLGGYRIIHYKTDGDLFIASGATLTLARGVVVEAKFEFDLDIGVDGSLAANGVTFSEQLKILVNDGGSAKLWYCDVNDAAGFIDCKTGSSGILQYCKLNELKIHSGACYYIVNNDFSSGSVTTEGEPNAIIDMEYNWWGTTDANEIKEKILDCNDDPQNKPCVDYEPFLTEPPPDTNGGAGDFEPDGDVDLFDFAYFAEWWSETNCGCSNWCGGADLDQNWYVDFVDLAVLVDNWLAGVSN